MSETKQLGTKSYTDVNAKTIDKWITEGWEWGQPISHETYIKALNNDWSVLLTPNKPRMVSEIAKRIKVIRSSFWWRTANANI